VAGGVWSSATVGGLEPAVVSTPGGVTDDEHPVSARTVATNGKHNDRDRVEVMVGMHTSVPAAATRGGRLVLRSQIVHSVHRRPEDGRRTPEMERTHAGAALRTTGRKVNVRVCASKKSN